MVRADIKPIETRYKGYRFRSRLEARWAVFFDALGWEWEYEPEGVVLPSGRPYLPDFRIRTIHAWVEIKPRDRFPLEVRDYAGMVGSGQVQESYFLLIQGHPGVDSYGVTVLEAVANGESFPSGPYVFACGRREDHEIWLFDEAYGRAFTVALCTRGCPREWADSEKLPLVHAGQVFDAYEQARSARFANAGWAR